MEHKDIIIMSVKEIERLKVVTDVTEKRISQKIASKRLNLLFVKRFDPHTHLNLTPLIIFSYLIFNPVTASVNIKKARVVD